MPSRREVLQLGLWSSLGVSACSTPTLQLVRNSFEAPAASKNRYGAPAGWIEQSPYPAMGVEIVDQGRFITVLAMQLDSRQIWVSGKKKIFITEHGRLVATNGLERDLVATRWLEPDPLLKLRGRGAHLPAKVYRELTLKAGKAVEDNVAVESEFFALGDEVITVLGVQRQTTRICERSRVRDWFWHTQAVFWLDRTDPVVWRSQQCYCPEIGTIDLELLKPPNAPVGA